jgi:hypothetical protein
MTPAIEAMIASDSPMIPTASLDEFLDAWQEDPNLWWRISCGHHLNLFEAAIDSDADCTEPHLGLATTRQLLKEIGARFQMGHEDMDYRTYDGGTNNDQATEPK